MRRSRGWSLRVFTLPLNGIRSGALAVTLDKPMWHRKVPLLAGCPMMVTEAHERVALAAAGNAVGVKLADAPAERCGSQRRLLTGLRSC